MLNLNLNFLYLDHLIFSHNLSLDTISVSLKPNLFSFLFKFKHNLYKSNENNHLKIQIYLQVNF